LASDLEAVDSPFLSSFSEGASAGPLHFPWLVAPNLLCRGRYTAIPGTFFFPLGPFCSTSFSFFYAWLTIHARALCTGQNFPLFRRFPRRSRFPFFFPVTKALFFLIPPGFFGTRLHFAAKGVFSRRFIFALLSFVPSPRQAFSRTCMHPGLAQATLPSAGPSLSLLFFNRVVSFSKGLAALLGRQGSPPRVPTLSRLPFFPCDPASKKPFSQPRFPFLRCKTFFSCPFCSEFPFFFVRRRIPHSLGVFLMDAAFRHRWSRPTPFYDPGTVTQGGPLRTSRVGSFRIRLVEELLVQPP